MEQFAKETIPVNLEDEMRRSYLDYAMSVIVGRALPDVRDGLKPVHRRVLFAMHEANNVWNRPYVKCARVVGDVLGKYHPHGDTATYEALVRMVQEFSLRYPLIDGQGNFGSIDGDSPAAYRYTESRLQKIAADMLADIDKETVDFVPNYDGKEKEPTVLPARVPNLLVNGSSGIAVGMATNIPPHNLGEVVDACLALIDKPEATIEDLMQHVLGPDFPTAGIIMGVDGIRDAYRTGRGRIYVRARVDIETDEKNGRQTIVVTELPYQVNKANLLGKIAELVREGRIEDISELRDESDKDGMRMVIELKRGAVTEVVLNNLYEHTAMQTTFGVNTVALVDGQPRLLNLRELIDAFLRHRREVVTRRSLFDLRKSRERAHVLEGLAIALENIDEMVALIKSAKDPDEARKKMLARLWPAKLVAKMLAAVAEPGLSRPEGLDASLGLTDKGYRLSEAQAQAILDLRLHRLTGLEQEKLLKEYQELLATIADLLDILRNPDRLMRVIREELLAIREQYADKRRTEIAAARIDLKMEDLIAQEDVVVTLSHAGYIKSQALSVYRSQRRGGRGKTATRMKEEDFVEKLLIANTHSTILCFSSFGKVYWLKVYEIPQAGREARGKPIVNLLSLKEGEKINAILPVMSFEQGGYVFMATSDGTVKKTELVEFSRPRPSGIIAIDLDEGNRLVGVGLTDGKCDIQLFSDAGKVVRFPEDDVRAMGRSARGVRGITLADKQAVIALMIVAEGTKEEEVAVLTGTAHGYGKRTLLSEYPKHHRGGQGVISIQVNERNGAVVGACAVSEADEVMLITSGGTLIRTRVKEISMVGRNTQGVRLIEPDEGETLAGIVVVAESDED